MSPFFVIAIIVALVTYVVFSALTMSYFRRKRQPGWAAWVPIYNLWEMASTPPVETTYVQESIPRVVPPVTVNVPSKVMAPPGPPNRRLTPQPVEAPTPPSRAAERPKPEAPGIPVPKASTPPESPELRPAPQPVEASASPSRPVERPEPESPEIPVPEAAKPLVPEMLDAPVTIEAEEPFDDVTRLTVRRKSKGTLITADGEKIDLTKATVYIGRNLSGEVPDADTQFVTVKDATRTVSKKHARLSLEGGKWVITDLQSTNGVYLVEPDGAETELVGTRAIKRKFMLGDAVFELDI